MPAACFYHRSVRKLVYISCLAVYVVATAAARAASPETTPPTALPATLPDPTPCVGPAADYHKVNPWILKAILKVESNFNPGARNKNPNGTVDVGMAQINSIHFGRLAMYGITEERLTDGCVATYVAAWHLAQQTAKYGNNWFGVAAYHSATACFNTRYQVLLWNTLTEWKVVAGPRLPVPSMASCAPASRSASQATVPTARNSVVFDAIN